ncbi:MOSC domain protein beta barrel domain protein [Gloeothece citriformis PCC 7424]|uniref:MOSC domain protein beta barrel domain protein n=1 Tax=Gloeothece citriformis (strain PCC 7424) TaxID=65393 RepID=B7KJN5_GLOC7|nr:MOSC N-terminal beta barrel domain-containing protein [Gloeothece citriformis]ACK69484.1 MOSC domain protein beta barrel domain protein [Gloeothece citriformis PCC 7424]
MSLSPYLKQIFIYPIKSLDGINLKKATILESGALKHDREYALIDEKGKFINGKRNSKIHQLRVKFEADIKLISLSIEGTDTQIMFHLDGGRTALESWLTHYFNCPVKLAQNTLTGFPDDLKANGPTIISTATLETLASWFPNVSVEEMRRRLRANLEIDGVPPFWEDQLFTESGEPVRFKIGDILIEGVNPCQRCIVPTRNSENGEETPDFQKLFINKRRETLPPWTAKTRFNHYYKVSINTNIPPSQAGKILHQGQTISID